MRRIAILCLTAAALAAAVADTASAQVQPAGTGEPAYTNSTQNTQWFEWPATSGADAYRIRFDYYENNTLKAAPVVNYANANSGSNWANWSGVATLQHGAQYGICAQGHYSLPNDSLFFPDGPNSCSMGTMLGRRAHTTIDRSKPTTTLTLAGAAAYVKDSKVPLRIDFADDVAGPFPANFLCFEVGVGPDNLCDKNAGKIYGYNASCSVPGGAGKVTAFNCSADYGAVPDGNLWACAIAADASIPDNPSGSNQSSTADKANLSDAKCDGVVLDRTAPTVAIGAASTSVKVGDLVSLQATASDATSGLVGAGQWTWGDNTGGASGDAVTHTYTQPGSYEVSLTITDAAGNAATAKKTITVTAGPTNPPGGGGGDDNPPGGGGGDDDPPGGGGNNPPGGGGGGTTIPPGGGGTTTPPGGGTTPPPADDDTSGGDDAPSLELDAPRTARTRAKAITVELTASGTGRVQLTLARGDRVVARTGVKLDRDGTADARLKFPKRLKAGRYTLKATYKPAGRAEVTASSKLTLRGQATARRAQASASPPEVKLERGPRALPDGRFHGDRPARTFAAR